MFTPGPDDYALRALEKVFGGIVSWLFYDGSGPSETLLTSIFGVLNIAVIIMALIVAAYSWYTLTADTASDGVIAGQSTDTKWTFGRIAAGAVLLLPISTSGLSLAQILVLYLLGSGSGLADYAWNKVADGALSGGSYTSVPKVTGADDFLIRGKFAEAMRTRTAGYLCKLHLNNLAKAYGKGGGAESNYPIQPVGKRSEGRGYLNYEWYFQDNGGIDAYRGTTNICGYLKLYVYLSDPEILGDQFTSGEFSFAERMDALAKQSTFNAGTTALDTIVDPAAKRIAESIYSGQRDEQLITGIIESETNRAALYFVGQHIGRLQTSFDPSQLESTTLETIKRDGWIFAGNWQRGLSSAYAKMYQSRSDLAFESYSRINMRKYFGSSWFGDGSLSAALYDPVERDFQFLESFDGKFQSMVKSDNTYVSSQDSIGTTNSSWSFLTDPLRELYGEVLSALSFEETTQWRDPLLDLQKVGSTWAVVGAGVAGLGGLAGYLGDIPILGTIGDIASDLLTPVGTALLAFGIVFTVILPFMPFFYYLGAVISWLLLAIEAMFAVPVAIIMFFTPARHSTLLGSSHNVVLTLFGVLMRPFFVVAGLVASMVVMRVVVDLINAMFRGMFVIMAPEGDMANIFIFLGVIFAYVLFTSIAVMHCCGLISGLGDSVMSWIGAQFSALGRENMGDRVAQSVDPTRRLQQGSFQGLGQGIGPGIGRVGGRFLAGLRRLPKP